MYESKTGTFGRVTVASLLSLGLTAGAVSIASAASHPTKTTSHTSVKAQKAIAFQGVIKTLSTDSVLVTNAEGVSKTFAIAPTTKILRATNVKNTVTLAVGDRVEVRALALTSTPLVATSINILAVNAQRTIAFQGVIATPYTPGSITVTNAKKVSKLFTIVSTTKILRASNVKNTANLTASRFAPWRRLRPLRPVSTSWAPRSNVLEFESSLGLARPIAVR